MKTMAIAIPILIGHLLVTGCSNKEETSSPDPASGSASGSTQAAASSPTAYAYELGSKKKGDMGLCVVCTVNEGKAPAEEEVKETLDYGGKTYVFCSEAEKAAFISDPKKYAGEP